NQKYKKQKMSLLESSQSFIEIINVYAQYPVKSVEEIAREEYLLQGEIGHNYNTLMFNFVDRWEKGVFQPDETELKILKQTYQLIPESIKRTEENLSEIKKIKQLTEDDVQKITQ